jgi:hypothetical protein
MGRQSIVLLSVQSYEVIHVGEPVRVDNWYSDPEHLHTIAVVASHFRGRVSVEASIKVKPTESDWFPVPLNDQYYVDYPHLGYGHETSTLGFSFPGRYVWLRAKIDRSLVIPLDAGELMVAACGFIDRILLNI